MKIKIYDSPVGNRQNETVFTSPTQGDVGRLLEDVDNRARRALELSEIERQLEVFAPYAGVEDPRFVAFAGIRRAIRKIRRKGEIVPESVLREIDESEYSKQLPHAASMLAKEREILIRNSEWQDSMIDPAAEGIRATLNKLGKDEYQRRQINLWYDQHAPEFFKTQVIAEGYGKGNERDWISWIGSSPTVGQVGKGKYHDLKRKQVTNLVQWQMHYLQKRNNDNPETVARYKKGVEKFVSGLYLAVEEGYFYPVALEVFDKLESRTAVIGNFLTLNEMTVGKADRSSNQISLADGKWDEDAVVHENFHFSGGLSPRLWNEFLTVFLTAGTNAGKFEGLTADDILEVGQYPYEVAVCMEMLKELEGLLDIKDLALAYSRRDDDYLEQALKGHYPAIEGSIGAEMDKVFNSLIRRCGFMTTEKGSEYMVRNFKAEMDKYRDIVEDAPVAVSRA